MAVIKHPAFPQPNDPDCRVWRFMDFSKFVNLLLSKQLWLSRADLLGDPYEGAISPLTYDLVRQQIENEDTIPRHAISGMINEFRTAFQNARRYTYVNCWHLNRHESAAMWKLYAKSDEAVAVVSTYRKLADALDDSHFVGEVTYTDYETSPIPMGNAFAPFMHKRVSFSHESEVRVVRWHPEFGKSYTDEGKHALDLATAPEGIAVSIDLTKLIDAVYVAPTSPAWFFNTVKELINSVGLSVPVTKSSLFSEPL